ncbi:hypothetical protein LguiA_035708 [Lonicera macranthoides]
MALHTIYSELGRTSSSILADFKYERDSVLVVNSHDYQECITSNPVSRFDDGSTLFLFDRSGLFYFISGEQGHCESGRKLIIRVIQHSEVESGQKLIIRVIHHSEVESPVGVFTGPLTNPLTCFLDQTDYFGSLFFWTGPD